MPEKGGTAPIEGGGGRIPRPRFACVPSKGARETERRLHATKEQEPAKRSREADATRGKNQRETYGDIPRLRPIFIPPQTILCASSPFFPWSRSEEWCQPPGWAPVQAPEVLDCLSVGGGALAAVSGQMLREEVRCMPAALACGIWEAYPWVCETTIRTTKHKATHHTQVLSAGSARQELGAPRTQDQAAVLFGQRNGMQQAQCVVDTVS